MVGIQASEPGHMIAERKKPLRRNAIPQATGPFGRWLRSQRSWRFEVNVTALHPWPHDAIVAIVGRLASKVS